MIYWLVYLYAESDLCGRRERGREIKRERVDRERRERERRERDVRECMRGERERER